MLAQETIAVPNTAAAVNNGAKKVTFRNYAPFTDCIRK